MSESVRHRIYLGLTGTVPLLTFYGVVAEAAAPLWIACGGAWLGVGLAAVNTTTKRD